MATGFTFGAKTTATPTFGTGSITFGTPATQPAPQQQFGFGNIASSAPNLFGTQTTTTSNLGFKPTGFGAPTSTPSTGFNLSTPGTGFSFGASTPSFGNPTSSAPSTGLTFGTPTTNTGFGAPAASTGFGAPVASTGFGAPSASTGFGAPAASTGLTFGTPTSSAATTALGFKPTTTTGLTFGTPASTGLSFGAPSTGFGTSTAGSTGLTFGTPATTASGLTFGATTTSTPALGLSFGTPSTAAPSLSFGTATTSLSGGTTTTGFGLGGLATSSAAPGFKLAPLGGVSSAQTTTATTQSVGLGGIASTQAKTGSSATAQKELPPKEQTLPNEFLQTVESFKNFVQGEKNKSTDVARCSVKEFHKVEAELDSLNHQFSQVENQLTNNRNLAEQLKYDTAKGLQAIEMAQRTQDTPPSLQYDNTAPLQYFLDLADSFEREMQLLKVKIDNTEKFVKKCNEASILTSQDLAQGLKRLHETFVALAGRMQAVHSQVEAQKELFLSLRKQAIKDNLNPFEKANKAIETVNYFRNVLKTTPPDLASGPTPFNSMSMGSNNPALAVQQTQLPTYPTATTTTTNLGFGFGNTAPTFGTASTNNSLFKPTGFGSQPFQFNTSSNFQLQKPPTGNKRGKQ